MKARPVLIALFSIVIVAMIAVTGWSSMRVPLWSSFDEFTWARSPWAVATLFDAYFGFLTFYVWVAYKERTVIARVIWFVLVMSLGNIAMASYMLIQLARMQPGDGVEDLLLRAHAPIS